jgi:hypothetical protein
MQAPSSRRPVAARRVGWSAAGALLAGAAMGSASGPVTACELSAALASEVGACVPTGAAVGAVGGALLGLVAAPLGRSGRRRRQPTAHRPAATTWAAAGLVLTALAAAVWVWTAEWTASKGGLDLLPLFVAGLGIGIGIGIGIGGVVLIVLTSRLLRRRGWARWGAVEGFSLAAVAALLAALDVGVAGNPWLNQPLPEVVPPAVFLVVSVAVVVLVLSPPTARDFAASRQAPLRDADPHQGSGRP